MWETHSVFKVAVSAETLPTWTEKDRGGHNDEKTLKTPSRLPYRKSDMSTEQREM